jgi:hypothetical protein
MKFKSIFLCGSLVAVMIWLVLFASCAGDDHSSDDWFPLSVGKKFVYAYESSYTTGSSHDTTVEEYDRTIELLSMHFSGNVFVYICTITTKHIVPYRDSVEVSTGTINETNSGDHAVSADFEPFNDVLIRDNLRRYPASDPSGTRHGIQTWYTWTFKKDVGLTETSMSGYDPHYGSSQYWGWTLK